MSTSQAQDRFRPADDAHGFPPIGDYAAIGDTRRVALISRQGSIDWLCLPHFSGPSVFAALLDRERGGRFAIRPSAAFSVDREYIAETNVLRTYFRTPTGTAVLTDCMTLLPYADPEGELKPQAEVLRLIELCDGEVELEVLYDPRPDFGRRRPRLENRGAFGWTCADAGGILVLRSELPLRLDGVTGALTATTKLAAGDKYRLSLTFTGSAAGVVLPLGDEADQRLEYTRCWWTTWLRQCGMTTVYRDSVVRSVLALKLLTYSLSGAVVAAPTTSLPERVGGVRNWDYRYCWLRDAALTFRVFADLGLTSEAQQFYDWLLHATRLTQPELNVLYDVYGETRLPERTLSGLEGYRSSRPVRVGNAADGQFQLDVYGSVIQAGADYLARGGAMEARERKLLVGFGETICRRWREPDEGIWEPRGGKRHHTYSKIMCWTGLEQLLGLHARGYLRCPAARFRRERAALRAAIEEHGFNRNRNSYVATFDGEEADASLLLAARYGYRQANHARMTGTYEYISRALEVNGLLLRYRDRDDGLPPGEGAFGIVNFWAVEYLARAGRIEEARSRFERLLSCANDVGLFAEEIDPSSRAALGNFPQAFTHVGLISAALALESVMRAADSGSERMPRERALY